MKLKVKVLGKYQQLSCDCGKHFIDLYDKGWKNNSTYDCNKCGRSLLFKDVKGRFFRIGDEVK